MTQMKGRTGLAGVAMAAVLVLAFQAMGSRSAAPPPVTAATVDLERVFEALTELAAEQTHLQELGANMDSENDAKQAELKRMDEELAILEVGTARYDELESQYIQKS